jgi:hypothetical protein
MHAWITYKRSKNTMEEHHCTTNRSHSTEFNVSNSPRELGMELGCTISVIYHVQFQPTHD